jgi:hypothetical protein
VCNREVAVDFSMGKTVFLKVQDEKESKKIVEELGVANTEIDLDAMDEGEGEEEGGEEEGEEEEGEEGEDGDMEVDEDGNVIEGEGEDEEEGEEEGEEQQEEEEEEEEEEDNTDDVEKGCTVFVRDLPFDAESRDLRSAMRSFGNILMAVIVKGKNTPVF